MRCLSSEFFISQSIHSNWKFKTICFGWREQEKWHSRGSYTWKGTPHCIAHNTSCVTSLKIKLSAEATSHYYSKPENWWGSSLACQQCSSLLLKHSGYWSKEIVYSLSTPNWCHPSSAAQPSKHRGLSCFWSESEGACTWEVPPGWSSACASRSRRGLLFILSF